MKSTIDSAEIFDRYLTQYQTSRVFSSFLLTGDENEKKKQLACFIAKKLNCEEKKFKEDCDCGSCRRIDSDSHPDVKWFGLDEDRASIKIEEVRELQNWLNLKSYEGKVKVFILIDAGRLTTEAQNALLKSLEEPPPQSLIILMTERRGDLLDTIVSRCREIKVPPFSEKETAAILKKEGAGSEEALYLTRHSYGNLAEAKVKLAKKWFQEKNKILNQVLRDPVVGFDAFATGKRDESLETLKLLSEWLRDASVLAASGDPSLLIHEDRENDLSDFVKNKPLDSVLRLFDEVSETEKAVSENANQKLAFQRLQVAWNTFIKQ